VEATILQDSTAIARGKLTQLATYTPSPGEFEPTLEMAAGSEAGVSGAVMQAHILSHDPPLYPRSARMAGRSGVVLLDALIGTDGHVERLTPVSDPDTDLTIAAIAAVRGWRYKPYALNGRPVQVRTTITVNFSLGRK
jgi:TonB family protein